MLHRSQVEWPCLSIDFLLKERCSADGVRNPKQWFPAHVNALDHTNTYVDGHNVTRHRKDRFPMTTYMVTGSQAQKKTDNRIYVMKWSEMHKTVHDDDVESDDSETETYKEPNIRFETVPHRGSINRIRSMHGAPIVATWNEDGEVGIYNVAQAVEELEKPIS